MADQTAALDGAAPASSDRPPPEMTQRRVLGLAVPIIGERFLQTLVGAVDTLMVGSLGATALAGVGIASEIVFFMLSTIAAVSVGGTVLVSRAIGAREPERANDLARQTVVWGLVLAVPLTILGYALAPALIGVFGAAPDVTAEATTYLRITASGMVVILLTFVFGSVLRGAGDSRTPLYASVVANVVNAAASYALIFGALGLPRLEVAGSAWGSVIGRSAGALVLLWLLMSGRRAVSIAGSRGWRPTVHTARSLSRIGVPAALEGMVSNVGVTTLVLVVALIGTDALAAQQIIFTAFSLALLPGLAFATAATALVGQSIGARDIPAARSAAAISLRWSVIWMVVAGAVYFLLAERIMGAFTDDQAVIDQGDGAMMALALTLPAWAYQSVFGGALRALGDARTPMLTNIVATWLGVALAWAGVLLFDAGLTFAWVAMLVTSPIMLLTMLVFRRRLAEQAVSIGGGDAEVSA